MNRDILKSDNLKKLVFLENKKNVEKTEKSWTIFMCMYIDLYINAYININFIWRRVFKYTVNLKIIIYILQILNKIRIYEITQLPIRYLDSKLHCLIKILRIRLFKVKFFKLFNIE